MNSLYTDIDTVAKYLHKSMQIVSWKNGLIIIDISNLLPQTAHVYHLETSIWVSATERCPPFIHAPRSLMA